MVGWSANAPRTLVPRRRGFGRGRTGISTGGHAVLRTLPFPLGGNTCLATQVTHGSPFASSARGSAASCLAFASPIAHTSLPPVRQYQAPPLGRLPARFSAYPSSWTAVKWSIGNGSVSGRAPPRVSVVIPTVVTLVR